MQRTVIRAVTFILYIVQLVSCSFEGQVKLPTFTEVFQEVVIEPGRFVSLKCSASGVPSPKVSWALDGRPLDMVSATSSRPSSNLAIGSYALGSDDSGGLLVASNLNISGVRPEDGGLYSCSATNVHGITYHRKRVNVLGKPSSRPMEDLKAVAGHAVTINCPVAGYPIDSIVWLKGHQRLPVNKRQETFDNGTLVLHDVQKSTDDGQYSCTASSSLGEATTSVRLFIMVAPAIEPFNFAKGIRQGQRTRLVCSITQGDPPFEFLWLKDSRRLEPAALSVGVRTDDFSSDLTFARVSSRHNGNYTCTVRNDVATVSHSTSLVVDVPPFWRVEPVDSSVVGGQNVLIDCLAEGVPAPSITWERAAINAPRFYNPISSGPHFEVYANGSLLVKNTQEEDGAYYLCQASNAIGPGLSKVVRLTVHVPPRFLLKFQSEAVRLGDEAVLKCEAEGDPPMTISWTLDKQIISIADEARLLRREESGDRRLRSQLRIPSANRRDSALFTCTVTNAYGSDEMNIRLIVQEPPEAPGGVKLVEKSSRVAKLSWSASFSGNSQITKYWITCHPRDIFQPDPGSPGMVSPGHVNVSVDSVPAEDGTVALIRGLRPATDFLCSVRAENDIGLSPPSLHVSVATDEEAPGGPPLGVRAEATDARSATVAWKAPERSTWNGQLKGYYIGYKVRSTQDQYLYKTLEVRASEPMSADAPKELLEHSVVLAGLRPATEYSVLVQAYNSMGTGPRSDEVTLLTEEDVPSNGPNFVRCSATSSESLALSWEAPPAESVNGQLQGYKVVYRPLGGDASQTRERVSAPLNEVKLSNLLKYTNYSVQVLPFNRRGTGAPSRPVYCRTDEDVPGPPSDLKVVISSGDSAIATWREPSAKNGLVTKYLVYWRELNKNRTKSAVTLPKTRSNVFSTRYRVPESLPQYKLSSLVESVPYEVWVTAATRLGEGPATPVLSIVTTRTMPARVLQLDETVLVEGVGGGDQVLTPIALGCHSVGSEPLAKSWSRNGLDMLVAEADGSLVVGTLEGSSCNFTCSVTNQFGSDQVTYHVRRALSTASVTLKVSATSFTSAQATVTQEELDATVKGGETIDNELATNSRGYELYYRVSRSEGHEWQVKPVPAFATPSSANQDSGHVGGGSNSSKNQTVYIENLICGAAYQAYIAELETGARTETVSFRTQGSAPVAPKKDEVLKLVNDSAILVYPLAWEQGASCPISKLTIEYRVSGAYAWRLLASRPISPEMLEIVDLAPKSIYSVRMTAHSTASPVTMAEYEVRVGLEDEDVFLYGSGLQRALLVDTTTLISLVSSCIVLLAGSVAVICLVIYKRKSQRKMVSASSSVSVNSRSGHYGHHRRPSAPTSAIGSQSTGLTVHSEEQLPTSNRPPIRNDSREKILSDRSGGRGGDGSKLNHSQASLSELPVKLVDRKLPNAAQLVAVHQAQQQQQNASSRSGRSSFTTNGSPLRGKLPAVAIPRKQLEEIEKDIYNEYDEITPYATFTLSHDDDLQDDVDMNTEEEFKTFTVKIGEPAYLFKGAMDGVPTTSRDYKTSGRTLGAMSSSLGPGPSSLCAKAREDAHYHCSNLNAHSVSSDRSSNCTELLRAYEFGRRYSHRVELTAQGKHEQFYDEEDEYGVGGVHKTDVSVTSEDAETPTDPGIRQFTKSPPRPNEQRIAGCFGHLNRGSSVISAATGLAEDTAVSDAPVNSTSSSSTSSEEDEPSSSIATTPTNEGRCSNFGAIPRDRSRKPSWTQQDTAPLRGRGFSSKNSSNSKHLVEADVNPVLPIELSSDDELTDETQELQRKPRRGSKSGPSQGPSRRKSPSSSGGSSSQRSSGRGTSKRPPFRTKSTVDEIEC